MKPIAILGCGPSGLLSAWAATLAGRPFAIFSTPVKSGLGGAQYLHKPIPGLTDNVDATMVTYRMIGDPVTYFQKAYGMELHHFDATWWRAENQEPAWNLMAYYDALWESLSPSINAAEISAGWLDAHIDEFDLVISTIPLKAICRPLSPHQFVSAPIRIKTEAINPNVPNGEIWYDGTDEHSWYRQSHVFGHGNTEWGPNAPDRLPYTKLINGIKPVRNTCDCWPNVVKAGRYGKWEKSEHTHDAFLSAVTAIQTKYEIAIPQT